MSSWVVSVWEKDQFIIKVGLDLISGLYDHEYQIIKMIYFKISMKPIYQEKLDDRFG